jgi:S-adenosylmethionine/arginine decarboxylase-like enzyme
MGELQNRRTRRSAHHFFKRTTSRKTQKAIRHHHLLVRMESLKCPHAQERKKAGLLVDQLLRDIQMKPLGKTRVYYVKVPEYNEGLTAITPIQTSHIAFHFWNRPDKAIMNDPSNTCLLQFDLYTCGTLNMGQVKKILDHLTEYEPRHVDLTLLNRNRSLEVEKHLVFDVHKDHCGWRTWVQRL